MNELALFAGAGGGILGGHLLGWRTVCAVEWEPYAASVLAQRQNDGLLPTFPIWDDVRTFDGRPWRGAVDVVSGGFPCQDISVAGKGAGIDGARSGMWAHMARIVGEVRPQYVFVENSPLLVGRGLVRVLADLADMGFDARWGVVGASDLAAFHERKRFWLVAHTRCRQQQEQRHSVALRDRGARKEEPADQASRPGLPDSWRQWPPEPDVGRVADGVAARVDRLKALGNGQVPRVAAAAWRLLTGGVSNTHNASLSGLPLGKD